MKYFFVILFLFVSISVSATPDSGKWIIEELVGISETENRFFIYEYNFEQEGFHDTYSDSLYWVERDLLTNKELKRVCIRILEFNAEDDYNFIKRIIYIDKTFKIDYERFDNVFPSNERFYDMNISEGIIYVKKIARESQEEYIIKVPIKFPIN